MKIKDRKDAADEFFHILFCGSIPGKPGNSIGISLKVPFKLIIKAVTQTGLRYAGGIEYG